MIRIVVQIFLLSFFIQNVLISPVGAKELLGKKFEDQIKVNQTELVLKGLGLKTYLMVKVFVAGLYVGKEFQSVNPNNDISKRIEVAYFYNIPGKKLAVETRRRIQLNTTKEEYAKIKKRIDQMDAYFVNLKPGDRYALTYIPQAGTQFSLNGNTVGTIEGADFSKALFAVWIGDKPIGQELKRDLLNQKSK